MLSKIAIAYQNSSSDKQWQLWRHVRARACRQRKIIAQEATAGLKTNWANTGDATDKFNWCWIHTCTHDIKVMPRRQTQIWRKRLKLAHISIRSAVDQLQNKHVNSVPIHFCILMNLVKLSQWSMLQKPTWMCTFNQLRYENPIESKQCPRANISLNKQISTKTVFNQNYLLIIAILLYNLIRSFAYNLPKDLICKENWCNKQKQLILS